MKFDKIDIRSRILFNKPYRNEIKLIYDDTINLIREWVHVVIPQYINKDQNKCSFIIKSIRQQVLNEYEKSLNERHIYFIYDEVKYEKYIFNTIKEELACIKEIDVKHIETAFEPRIDITIEETFFDTIKNKSIIVTPFDEHIYKIVDETNTLYMTMNEKGEERIFDKHKEKLHYFEVLRDMDDVYKIKRLFTYTQRFTFVLSNIPNYITEWLTDFEPLIMKMPEQFRSSVELGTDSVTYVYNYKNPYIEREIKL